MDVFIGVLFLLAGLAFAFAGLRFWFILLPALGFFVGLNAGVALMYWAFDEGIFSTALGLFIGFFIGLLFAVFAYAFWYVGAILAAGYLGATLGAGLMDAIDVDSNFLIFLVAVALAVVFIVAAVLLWLPVYTVIVNTAFAGSSLAIGGFMLVFNVIDRSDLGFGTIAAAINESWLWIIAWGILAAFGIVNQLRNMASVVLPQERWDRISSNPF